LPLALVGALTLGAAAGAMVGVAQSPTIPGVGVLPIDFVISSAQNTASQRTADLTYRGTLHEQGKSMSLSGTGQADFTRNAFIGTIQFHSIGNTVVETELSAGNRFYIALVVDGVNTAQALSGKHWIQAPDPVAGAIGGIGFGTVDPLTQLKAAQQQGATVVLLGTSVIDGDTVSGYSVTSSRQEVQQRIQDDVASGQVPASFGTAAEHEADTLGAIRSDVYFDAAGLLRRQSLVIAAGTSGAHGRIDVTYTHFGAPISIAVPAASDVLSFSAFLKDTSLLSTSQ
jgi:hypothetical protein